MILTVNELEISYHDLKQICIETKELVENNLSQIQNQSTISTMPPKTSQTDSRLLGGAVLTLVVLHFYQQNNNIRNNLSFISNRLLVN